MKPIEPRVRFSEIIERLNRMQIQMSHNRDGEALRLAILIIENYMDDTLFPPELIIRVEQRDDDPNKYLCGMSFRPGEGPQDRRRRWWHASSRSLNWKEDRPMKEFEYLKVPGVQTEDELNRFGRNGWELIGLFPSYSNVWIFYFKRELPEPRPAHPADFGPG